MSFRRLPNCGVRARVPFLADVDGPWGAPTAAAVAGEELDDETPAVLRCRRAVIACDGWADY